MGPAYFTWFPQLPVEIRLQIWQLALEPEAPSPVLFCFKEGCWKPRYLTRSDPEFNCNDDELNLVFEFRHELLDQAGFTVPLFSVSREARSVALPCILSQELRRGQDTASCIFVRRYDPWRDLLLLPTPAILRAFLVEPIERLFEPDLDQKYVNCPHPLISRLAITLSGLASLETCFFGLWENCHLLEMVYVVIEEPEDMQERQEGHHWEAVSAHDAVYVWDASQRRMTWCGEHKRDEPLREVFAQMERCTEGLVMKLVELGKDRFEMRVVHAVPR
ncbi:hypothetical protein CCM_02590 [Cordyceps militaris CM01]|uniref:2EXR domain-containing protein n=1 Tax=Cordyceps militaris (strain CM01) TaxID=983644 RepID=G3JAK3_CORMM|nr:uncharacterized protein CCM_02590 [Cordyceps militaris CM01]EGX94319.1 hypothetical protein CCM_02590 [Cordyceps militaris CM01]